MRYRLNRPFYCGQFLLAQGTIVDTAASEWSHLPKHVPPLDAEPLDDEARRAMNLFYAQLKS